ncbi:MAG: choice-of-anchor Q domain-containing protein [Bacteroidales bacterium]|nr:choice-of-anchor Q domain-containing protein [Bacteroidales bacterium]
MKLNVTLFFLMISMLGASGQQASRYGNNIYVEGDVSGVWMADTVFVTGHITLPPNESLEIPPGVYVEFQGYYGFLIRGYSFLAEGAPGAPVVFSVNDTTGLHDIYSPAGGWGGITIMGSSSKDIPGPWIEFRHCRIEYAKAIYGESNANGGGVRITGEGQYLFYKTTFYKNHSYFHGGGAYFQNASVNFHGCLFEDNYAGHPPTELQTFGSGGGLSCKHGGGYITNNTFLNNEATGVGGGLCLDSSDVVINSNIFKYNFSIIGGGVGYLRSTPGKLIVNNLIAENIGYYFGGGIAFIDFAGKMVNNTIANNTSAMGGGMYLNDDASPIVENTIFWGNTAGVEEQSQVFIWDVFSDPGFYYCNMQFGVNGIGGAGFYGDYIECIETDPLFAGEGEHPYRLSGSSPAINAGDPNLDPNMVPATDLAGNPRIIGSIIDIGAYEFQGNGTPVYTVSFEVFNQYEEPLPDAVITLNGLTNEAGNYVFHNVQPGTYTYSSELFCYHSLEGELTVTGDDVHTILVQAHLPGDANGDGVIDVTDIITLVNYFINANPDPFCLVNADTNNDGEINVLDVIDVVALFSESR